MKIIVEYMLSTSQMKINTNMKVAVAIYSYIPWDLSSWKSNLYKQDKSTLRKFPVMLETKTYIIKETLPGVEKINIKVALWKIAKITSILQTIKKTIIHSIC